MRLPVQVLVYVVRPAKRGRRYLLLRRIPSRGGFWQGITGGLEQGETMAEAAARELAEEASLIPVSLHAIDYHYSFPMEDRWRPVYPPGTHDIVEHVYLASVDENAEPDLSCEHDAWRWCTFDEALDLLSWPENVEALRRCEMFAGDQLDRLGGSERRSARRRDGVPPESDEEAL